ncbi:MAG: rod shape-determining protein [Oscillospiraceae bacterium]
MNVSYYDIGIDLGTTNVVIYSPDGELLLKEPSVIAQNVLTGKTIAVGNEAFTMLGKTPDRIRAILPMGNGVISDYDMTREMITYFIKKIYGGKLIKPRVIICVPSGITDVETNAVVGAATEAGARKVYLIEEPVAAAIGAGLKIGEPDGKIVLDIGGGTSDVAVLSFNGIVCKRSLRVAGRSIDDILVKYVKNNYRLLIGMKMAERAKIEGVAAYPCFKDDETVDVKGRDLQTGLPKKLAISKNELSLCICNEIAEIVKLVRTILDITPPELSADISKNGIIMTGGSSQLTGLSELISRETRLKVTLAENPSDCVAIGTALAFNLLDTLNDGFIKTVNFKN